MNVDSTLQPPADGAECATEPDDPSSVSRAQMTGETQPLQSGPCSVTRVNVILKGKVKQRTLQDHPLASSPSRAEDWTFPFQVSPEP